MDVLVYLTPLSDDSISQKVPSCLLSVNSPVISDNHCSDFFHLILVCLFLNIGVESLSLASFVQHHSCEALVS